MIKWLPDEGCEFSTTSDEGLVKSFILIYSIVVFRITIGLNITLHK